MKALEPLLVGQYDLLYVFIGMYGYGRMYITMYEGVWALRSAQRPPRLLQDLEEGRGGKPTF